MPLRMVDKYFCLRNTLPILPPEYIDFTPGTF